jgi:predicted Na+-dependent transporter
MRLRALSALAAPLPLVVVAAAAGVLWPSEAVADRSDLILAALVAAVALTIEPARLRAAKSQWRRIVAAVMLPVAVLLPVALGLGALFDGPAREGLVALGLASSEVATASFVAVAGGEPAVALAVVTLSLAVTAVAAPALAPLLVDSSVAPGDLIVRFTVVVLVPLTAGLAVRARIRSARVGPAADRAATLVLGLLVYAALGDLGERSRLGGAVVAALLFLMVSVALALVLRPLLGDLRTGGFTFALRDFAVAAALAGQLGTPGASATPAVYGVVMLVFATASASALRRARL